jgi:hypothetical protein
LEHLFCSISINDKESNFSRELFHPVKEPGGSFAIMKGKVGGAGFHFFLTPE